MAARLSRRAQARQARLISARIERAVLDLTSPDEQVRAQAVRQLCPCRTLDDRTLDVYVVPMRHDPSPVVRWTANRVLTEELEHEMVREARSGDACLAGVGRRPA